MVRGAHGQNDDHDEQGPAGGQDGYQGSIVRRLLEKQESGWWVSDQRRERPDAAFAYLGDFLVVLCCQSGFYCENSFDESAGKTFFELLGLTFAVNLHKVKVYFAVALLPHQSTVSILHVCHQAPAHLHQVFLLLVLETQSRGRERAHLPPRGDGVGCVLEHTHTAAVGV